MSTYKPGEGKEGEKIWFPKLTGTSQVDLLDVARILAKRSTASEADVYLVMMGLVDLIPDLLAEGKTIKMERFGTFRLHARVKTESSPDKITSRNIKEIRLSYKPDNAIKKVLQNIDIEREQKE
jgi:predicted histone-like DNA-binding protein